MSQITSTFSPYNLQVCIIPLKFQMLRPNDPGPPSVKVDKLANDVIEDGYGFKRQQ